MDAFATLGELRAGLDRRDLSAVELARMYLERIERFDPTLNSFITVTPERALAQADAADRAIARGRSTALTGIPYAHKDIFCTRDVRTSCGSRMLDNFIAPYDATVTRRLDAAGAVMLGKTNMDEFAMGSSNESSFYGPVANPWRADCVPGGSSGGSAAAVAAGLCPWATGTDTGGSIRQPAAFCGISGLKPTYGRVSRFGMVAFASSLDQGGPLARTVADLLPALRSMAGFDPLDSTCADRTDAWLTATDVRQRAGPLTIGLPRQYFDVLTGHQDAYTAAREVLEGRGHTFVDVDLPSTPAAIAAYYVIAGAEASTNLSRYDGVRYGHRADNVNSLDELYRNSRSEGFGTEVKRRILTGTYALSVGYYDAYYTKAQKIRRLIRDEFLRAFEAVDVILAPTAPGPAFRLGALTGDAVAMYQQDAFTIPASLAGLPALSVPCGTTDGLPLGMQLIGPHFAEERLLDLGAVYQAHTAWQDARPEGFA